MLIDGKALRAIRRAKDLSQKQAAEAIGVDQSTISHIEGNTGRFGLETVRQYAAFLGVKLPNGNKNRRAA